jgi:hypothetical protein
MAAITFEEGRFYVGLWYFDLPNERSEFGHGGNFLGTFSRPDDDPEDWLFEYRLRHYRDERIHEHDDTLRSYALQGRGSEVDALRRLEVAMALICKVYRNPVLVHIEVRGDLQAVIKKLDGLPMFHRGEAQAKG